MLIRRWLRVFLLVLLASSLAFCETEEPGAPPGGQAIFEQRCAKCHGDKGQGVDAVVTFAGPSIQAEHNPGRVMAAMQVGPSHMPSFAFVLSVQDMHSVADYVTQQLAVIPLTEGDVAQGGKLFRVYCAPCHRTAVRGGALAFTGVNAPALMGKSAALIAGAIRMGPGPMPAFPKSVLDDNQLNSIVSYVKFVQQPPSPGGTAMHWDGPVAEGFAAWVMILALIAMAVWIEKGGKG